MTTTVINVNVSVNVNDDIDNSAIMLARMEYENSNEDLTYAPLSIGLMFSPTRFVFKSERPSGGAFPSR